jgi:hypothetical protein
MIFSTVIGVSGLWMRPWKHPLPRGRLLACACLTPAHSKSGEAGHPIPRSLLGAGP